MSKSVTGTHNDSGNRDAAKRLGCVNTLERRLRVTRFGGHVVAVRIDGEAWMDWCQNMDAVPKDKTLVWLKLPDGTVDLGRWDGEWNTEFGNLDADPVAWAVVTI